MRPTIPEVESELKFKYRCFMVQTEIPEQLRRVPTRGRGRATIDRLLDAADEILATEGWQFLATTHVAEVAEVSVGTVYHWFGDKEAIVEALARQYWSELAELVAEVADGSQYVDPVGDVINALSDGFRDRPGFLALWFSRLRTEEVRDATRPNRILVGESVQRMLAGAYPQSAPETRATVAAMLVLIGDGLLREAFRLDPHGDQTVLDEGRLALSAYIVERLGNPTTKDSE
jgi:AcrR family transcriptional regulator